MSAVSELIVREYFEMAGFLVRQPVKYQVAARAKRPEEEADLVVWNPRFRRGTRPPSPQRIVWTRTDLEKVERAVVSILGWHTDRISPAVLRHTPEVLRVTDEEVIGRARSMLGGGSVLKILCLPELPASESLRAEAIDILRENGVNGVLLFRNILLELSQMLDKRKSYEKSPPLQILRILKNYGLLRDAQLELFAPRRRRRTSRGSSREPQP